MQILIPMAGAGQRFRDAGYAMPKPLIPVDGIPMVVRIVEDLPAHSRLVFVVNAEHIQDHYIDDRLREYFPDARIVVAPGLTDGQACSTQLGISELNGGEDVLVAACDNTHVIDATKLAARIESNAVDALLWTYRNEPRVLVNPQWYGWVATLADNQVARVSVKRPISTSLLEDQVISGTFWFRSASLLDESINRLVAANRRVNGEFYLDSVAEILLEMNCRVETFEVQKYIGWGTPADYEDYQHWSHYVRRRNARVAA